VDQDKVVGPAVRARKGRCVFLGEANAGVPGQSRAKRGTDMAFTINDKIHYFVLHTRIEYSADM
jgi:hypothetical protein